MNEFKNIRMNEWYFKVLFFMGSNREKWGKQYHPIISSRAWVTYSEVEFQHV